VIALLAKQGLYEEATLAPPPFNAPTRKNIMGPLGRPGNAVIIKEGLRTFEHVMSRISTWPGPLTYWMATTGQAAVSDDRILLKSISWERVTLDT